MGCKIEMMALLPIVHKECEVKIKCQGPVTAWQAKKLCAFRSNLPFFASDLFIAPFGSCKLEELEFSFSILGFLDEHFLFLLAKFARILKYSNMI